MIKFKIYSLIMMVVFSSCMNVSSKSSGSALSPSGVFSGGSGVYTQVLSNFTYAAASGSSGTATTTLTLTANSSAANYQSFNNFCSLTGNNACSCQMVWTQLTTSNGTSYSYSRTKQVPVTQIQAGAIQCAIDTSIWNEIPNSTSIAFTVVPASTNTTGLNTQALNWMKGTSLDSSGDFLDSTLTPFQDIHRYTCFSLNASAYEMVNMNTTLQGQTQNAQGNTPTMTVILGSQACTGNGTSGTASAAGSSSSGTSGGNTCPTPRSGYSAQSYYRNFYINSGFNLGSINQSNNNYYCPQVLEPITTSASSSGGLSTISSSQNNYWPLDSSFSLATVQTSDWSVGVTAAGYLSKSGDNANSPTATPTPCNGDTDPGIQDSAVVKQCLGYAKKPNTDGTCGTMQDSTGKTRYLTRLRRFRVVYPPIFDSTGATTNGQAGAPLKTNPAADEILVADRLEVDSTGTPTGNMIYGPKPCNFAWFDHEGVVNRQGKVSFNSDLYGDQMTTQTSASNYATPGYVATSNYFYKSWDGTMIYSVNPDGIVYPNSDKTGTTTNALDYGSCSMSLPLISYQNGVASSVRVVTTNFNRLDAIPLGNGRNIYMREIQFQPVDPWVPNYVEDNSFQACVPLPSVALDPPLHFYKQDDNTMGWCAKVYPTQNPYWYNLNKAAKPFTTGNTVPGNIVYVPNPAPTPNAGMTPFPSPGMALVSGFTSHQQGVGASAVLDALYNKCGGTQATQICSMTGYSGAAVNNASKTCPQFLSSVSSTGCDRTVLFDSSLLYQGFPLQAADTDIVSMLSSDLQNNKTYSCQYSVNSNSAKVKTSIPRTGCCGLTGNTAILNNITNGGSGHLEPFLDPSATSTSNRFCGFPEN